MIYSKENKLFGLVYIATNKINGKLYIGLTTKGLKFRKYNHFSDAKRKKTNSLIHKAIRKYGRDSFSWKVLCECKNKKELMEKESFFVENYNTYAYNKNSNGYNMTKGGDDCPMYYDDIKKRHSINTKKALSDPEVKHRQKLNTKIAFTDPEIKKNLIRGQKKSWNKERRKSCSKANSGQKNPNAKYLWIIIKEDVILEETGCLKEWCKRMRFNYNTVYGSLKRKGSYKEYIVEKKLKQGEVFSYGEEKR